MTRKKKDRAKAIADELDDFAFDAADLEGDPFAFDDDDDSGDIFATGPSADGRLADLNDVKDEWADLPGEPSDAIAHDLLSKALREDPFATTSLDDCIPTEGITPAALSRYLRASAAFVASCHALEPDYEAQEIHRLIALYWLRKSRAYWLD